MKIKIFIDSSVVIAALLSSDGGSAKIFKLCEAGIAEGWISNTVIEEVDRNIKGKFAGLKLYFYQLLKAAGIKISKNPSKDMIKKAEAWIKDHNDAPILAAAKFAKVDVVLTLDIRHFIKDTDVAKKSGMQIMTPGEFLKGFMVA
ncbi:MAG: PIN domain-containing protein [Patescibacteria group bacterium]